MSSEPTFIPPVDAERLTPEGRRLLDQARAPEIIGVLANASEALPPWLEAMSAIRRSPDLDPVLRELVVLRTASRLGCEYELHHHRPDAVAVGATHDQIEAACGEAPLRGGLGVVLALVDDLFQGRGVDRGRIDGALQHVTPRALVEAIMIAGVYVTVGRLIEASGLTA